MLTETGKENEKKGKRKQDKTEENISPKGTRIRIEKKKKKFSNDSPEERMNNEMSKVSLLQARIAKKKKQQKKIKAVTDYTSANKKGNAMFKITIICYVLFLLLMPF